MKLILKHYPKIVVNLIQQKRSELKMSIHDIDVMELNGWNLFFYKGDCFLKCEIFVPGKSITVNLNQGGGLLK